MLIRMYQIEVSKIDMLLKRFNWGGPELLTLSYMLGAPIDVENGPPFTHKKEAS